MRGEHHRASLDCAEQLEELLDALSVEPGEWFVQHEQPRVAK